MLVPRGEDVVYKVTFGGFQEEVNKNESQKCQKSEMQAMRAMGVGVP